MISPHPRCVIVIEGSEESGSIDLIYYLDQLKKQIGTPSFIICLDSSAGNYEQLWGTTSLRGILIGELSINVLNKGIHSGLGSGVAPSVFAILRSLLDRIEDAETGNIIVDDLKVAIPEDRLAQAKEMADNLGKGFLDFYDFFGKTTPLDQDLTELVLNRSWRPALSVTGISGIPTLENAGNVSLPRLTVKLSIRTPPTLDITTAEKKLKSILEKSPPFQASVTFTPEENSTGWNAPTMENWLTQANHNASQLFFNKPAAYIGEGGSIPFMGMLGDLFPKAQFMITGLLGPKSNAHGPNEFLHIEYAKKTDWLRCLSYC